MATDGINIIDSDTSRDTYMSIMDMYDSNIDIKRIKEEFPFDIEAFDDYDYELYLTSLAQAFWEIGLMDESLLKKVKGIVEKGISVKVWTDECDEKTGRKRQQVLNRFITKISKKNDKIRSPKKYRRVTNFHFQPDDLLAFKLRDGRYRAVICAQITQQRGQCTYDLVATTYNDKDKPTMATIFKYDIVGRFLGSDLDKKTMFNIQPGLDIIWKQHPIYEEMFFGLSYKLVTHKDFFDFKDKFEVIGKLRIKDTYKREHGYGYESSFERFESIFIDLENHMKVFSEKSAPIKIICETNE